MTKWATIVVLLLVLAVQPLSAQTDDPQLPPLQVITPENAADIELLGFLSPGRTQEIIWSPDSSRFGIVARSGVWIYEADHPDQAPVLLINQYANIFEMRFSPDGSRVAFSTAALMPYGIGADVHLFDSRTGRKLGTYSGRPGSKIYPDFAFNPQSTLIAYTNRNTIHIRDVRTGALLKNLTTPEGGGYEVAFTPDGEQLIAINYAGMVHRWETRTFTRLEPFDTRGSYSPPHMEVSPDGSRLIFNGYRQTTHIWDLQRQEEIAILPIYAAQSPVFSHDGTLVALGNTEPGMYAGDFALILISNVETGTIIATFPGKTPTPYGESGFSFLVDDVLMIWTLDEGLIQSAVDPLVFVHGFSPDATRLVTAQSVDWETAIQTITLWDTTSDDYRQLEQFTYPAVFGWAVEMDASAETLVITDTGIVTVLNIATEMDRPDYRLAPPSDVHILQRSVGRGRIDITGTYVAFPKCYFGVYEFRLYRVSDIRQRPYRDIFGAVASTNRSCATEFAFTPDGSELVSGFDDGILRVWNTAQLIRDRRLDLDTGGERLRWQAHEGRLADMKLLADGRTLVTAGYSDEQALNADIRVWDLQTGDLLRELAFNWQSSYMLRSIAISPDERMLAVSERGDLGGDPAIRLFDLASLEFLDSIPDSGGDLTFSPDGSLLLTTGYSGFALFDVAAGEMLTYTIGDEGANPGFDAVFHPSGRYLISISASGVLGVWGVEERQD